VICCDETVRFGRCGLIVPAYMSLSSIRDRAKFLASSSLANVSACLARSHRSYFFKRNEPNMFSSFDHRRCPLIDRHSRLAVLRMDSGLRQVFLTIAARVIVFAIAISSRSAFFVYSP
jgi:hypothetical protein